MRRFNELFFKNKDIGLIADCINYCWQTDNLTDDELLRLEKILGLFNTTLDGVNDKCQ